MPRASSTASLARRERLVGALDLAGVDQRLAVEAQLAALPALGEEAVGVLHVVVDAVEDRDAGGPGGQQRQRQRGQQRRAAGHVLGVQLLDEVVGAHHEHGEPVGGGGDLAASKIASGVSTIAHSLVCSGAPAVSMRGDQRADLVGAVDLGHDDRRRARPGARGGEVVVVPLGADAVDPDGDLAPAVLAGADGRAGGLAGGRLGVGGDGVLEVEDQPVARRCVLAFSSARSLELGM